VQDINKNQLLFLAALKLCKTNEKNIGRNCSGQLKTAVFGLCTLR